MIVNRREYLLKALNLGEHSREVVHKGLGYSGDHVHSLDVTSHATSLSTTSPLLFSSYGPFSVIGKQWAHVRPSTDVAPVHVHYKRYLRVSS